MLHILALTGLTTFPLPILGRTWTVDDTPGPGVDFATLQAAFDAAAPNDVILVQPGAYAGGVLAKGLRVVGQGDPVVSGLLRIEGLPPRALAVVSGLRGATLTSSLMVRVADSPGTVVLEDVTLGGLAVLDAADVRLRGIEPALARARLEITRARVEAVECTFRGEDGPNQWCGTPADPTGLPGARLFQGGILHAARSSFFGGMGGNSGCPDLGLVEPGGDGGGGISVWGTTGAPCELLVSGVATDLLTGGLGGWSSLYGQASAGHGIDLYSCSARISGVTVASTYVYPSPPSTIATPALPDPTMRLLEVPTAGTNLTFRVVAPPGANARMSLGALPVVVPIGGVEEDVLVARAQSFELGTVPPSGVQGFNFALPAAWPAGTTFFAQATLTYPGGELRRTHSIPVVVR
ncbi:MAG: hypothetical protein JNK02_01095 [Planctomycetes bacterium]|nr:hypothetical protein [Planctomycetota bacterium]